MLQYRTLPRRMHTLHPALPITYILIPPTTIRPRNLIPHMNCIHRNPHLQPPLTPTPLPDTIRKPLDISLRTIQPCNILYLAMQYDVLDGARGWRRRLG